MQIYKKTLQNILIRFSIVSVISGLYYSVDDTQTLKQEMFKNQNEEIKLTRSV